MRENMSWVTFAGIIGIPVGLLYMFCKVLAYRNRMKLENKVVLITGATSGVGRACAFAFYKAGCHVILASRNSKQLQAVQEQLEILPAGKTAPRHPPKYVSLDLEDLQSIPSKAKQALAFHGRIDVLINNAGISSRGSVEETSLKTDMKVMTINYFGHVALTKDRDLLMEETVISGGNHPFVASTYQTFSHIALLPHMLQSGGHIVALSSLQGKISIPYRSAYGASKHALQAFFDSLRAEVAKRNLHICVFSPSYIRTSLSLNAVCGDGSQYGQMEESLAQGMSADYIAERIVTAVIYGEKEVVVGPLLHRTVCYLRNISPDIFFRAMESRAKTERRQYVKNN